jgi:hypothetical protein
MISYITHTTNNNQRPSYILIMALITANPLVLITVPQLDHKLLETTVKKNWISGVRLVWLITDTLNTKQSGSLTIDRTHDEKSQRNMISNQFVFASQDLIL